MWRAAVAVTCLLTAGLASAQTGPGKERWPVKTSIISSPKRHTISLADFLKLPQPDVPKKSATFDPMHDRIPPDPALHGFNEGDLITLKGWLHLVAFESSATGDEDYHIQISNSATDGGNCVIVEAPKPEFIDAADLKARSNAIRKWVRAKLLHDSNKEPSETGNVMQHDVYVQATGQLFLMRTTTHLKTRAAVEGRRE